ncbi:MAG: cytochrome c3 family protein [Desulfovibrionaceae bacterium]|nr:cytochrome c3 family protein [Desulfovibrionaceae bacterium]MDD4952398.1 cytochrome c3 family protein [Desulfovibrionaceae bacterium]
MKRILTLGLACLIAVGLSAPSPAGATQPKAPCDLVLKAPAGAKATKTPVAFSHAGHKALDCKACHHKWDGKGDLKGCSSKGCHANFKAKKGEDSFYAAFHATAKNSCLGCHKDLKKANKAAGPTACAKCHPK